MGDDWVVPKPEVHLVGNVVFVCADCRSRIEGEHVLWPLEDGELVTATKAYHPDHVPQEMTDGR